MVKKGNGKWKGALKLKKEVGKEKVGGKAWFSEGRVDGGSWGQGNESRSKQTYFEKDCAVANLSPENF